MKPPLLPAEVLRRVVRVSMLDGISVLVVAGLCALVSASWRDVPGAVVGLLVAGAGAIEMHGAGMLRSGDGRGMRWLYWGHFQIGLCMMVYIALRVSSPDIATMQKAVTPEVAEQLKQISEQTGMTVDQMLVSFMRIVYFSLAAATVIYQGGMTIYYSRRQAAVAAAILELDQG